MSTPSRIAILSFAHMHAQSYASSLASHPDAVLAGVWDDDSVRGAENASAHGAPFFEDLAALLARPLDGVVITSENIRHRELVEAVCSSGEGVKAILCEKPLATTHADGEAMISACDTAGIRLATAFPCRYSPPFQRAAAIVRSGKLGRVLAIRATNHGACPFGWFVDVDKSGGGAIIDHTVHVADLNRVLLGAEAVDVYAESGNRMYHQTWEDTGFLTITYAGGTFATLDTSWTRPPKSFKTWGDVTLEIVGENGVLNVDLFGQALGRYDESNGSYRAVGWGSNIDAGLVDDFLRLARGEEAPAIATGQDGLAAADVAFAAYESLRTRQAVQVS
ncbi:MAG TPA: Gfo/Idh/MocA family oxidoreductase [Capsulimonadaceae bacterium]